MRSESLEAHRTQRSKSLSGMLQRKQMSAGVAKPPKVCRRAAVVGPASLQQGHRSWRNNRQAAQQASCCAACWAFQHPCPVMLHAFEASPRGRLSVVAGMVQPGHLPKPQTLFHPLVAVNCLGS